MNIINTVLRDQQTASSYLTNGHPNVQKLKSACRIRIHQMAWKATRGIINALEIIESHPDFEPTPEELCDHVTATDHGHWRQVVETAGYLTLKFKLETDLRFELQLLETTMSFASAIGRKVVGLFPACDGEKRMAWMDLTVTVRLEGHPEIILLEFEEDKLLDDTCQA